MIAFQGCGSKRRAVAAAAGPGFDNYIYMGL